MRFRYVYMGLGTLFVAILLTITDPDLGIITELPFGATFIANLAILTKSIIYVAMLHVSRKALFDYLDLEDYFKEAIKTPEGSSGALNATGLYAFAIAIVIFAATH